MGWGLAVVYVGQQTWGKTPRTLIVAQRATRCGRRTSCSTDLISADEGTRNADDAVARATSEGFADRRRSSFSTSSAWRRFRRRCATIIARGPRACWRRHVSRPGIYTHEHNARANLRRRAATSFRAAGDTTTPRFWIAGGKGFDEGRAPQDVGFAFAGVWQGVIDVARSVAEGQAAGGRQRRVVGVAIGVGNGSSRNRTVTTRADMRVGGVAQSRDTFARADHSDARIPMKRLALVALLLRGAARCAGLRPPAAAAAVAGAGRRRRRRLGWHRWTRCAPASSTSAKTPSDFAAAARRRATREIAGKQRTDSVYAAKAPGVYEFQKIKYKSRAGRPRDSGVRVLADQQRERQSTPRSSGCTAASTAIGTQASIRSSSRR